MGHQNQHGIADLANGGEVFDRVKTHLGKHMRVDDHRPVKTQEQGVAIGLGRSHHLRANVARCARLVVHHHLLAQAFGQLLGDQTPAGVRHAPGSEGHHQANGLGWIDVLRPGPTQAGGQQASQQGRAT